MTKSLQSLLELIEHNWKQMHLLVIGDVALDRYLWGEVERVCPEAPVPIVRVCRRSDQPGWAANLAMNIAGLGAQATIAGFAGDDLACASLEEALMRAGVRSRLTKLSSHPTSTKLRIIGRQQQLLRVDVEPTSAYRDEAYLELRNRIAIVLNEVQAVILSDYAGNVLRKDLCRAVITEARQRKIPVIVQPQETEFSRYAGATIICANFLDFSAATGLSQTDVDGMLAAAASMLLKYELDFLAVALGEQRIAVLHSNGLQIFPTIFPQTFDVSGVADTFTATLALAVAANLPIEDAALLANVAAGIALRKPGIVPIAREELIAGLMQQHRT